MHIDLSNKTAVVSGSTAGIGFAIARGLAESGATVIVSGRGQTAVDAAIEPGAVVLVTNGTYATGGHASSGTTNRVAVQRPVSLRISAT